MKKEEVIRQDLLIQLTKEFSFPKELIGVERELSTLLHLQEKQVPKRRYDIICFAANLDNQYPVSPLLLIECKAVDLTMETFDQVIGYNFYVNAPYIAIANHERIILLECPTNKVSYGLRSYEELKTLELARRKKSLSCF
jgi:hypothetical protein